MRSVIDVLDLSVEEIDELLHTALDIIENPVKYAEKCKRKKIATLFFEPSTRTRLSFEAAMHELGGDVLSVVGSGGSSVAKGESVADTAKTVSNFVDIIAIRHPKEGAALVTSLNATIPVINAGDGGHFHPTQTLADLLTIYREKNRLSDLTIGICGDLKYGRTVHSLIHAMSRYKNNKFVLISPKELSIPDYIIKETFEKEHIEYKIATLLEEELNSLDMLYMTRIQRERFDDQNEYERLKDSYILTENKMKLAKEDCIVLHPLPRVNEISVKIDNDKRACYFKQVYNGKYMRMALILKLLAEKENNIQNLLSLEGYNKGKLCKNPRCIVSTEQEIEHMYKILENGQCKCIYCDSDV